VVDGLQVIPVENLREAVGFLEGEIKIPPAKMDLSRIFDQSYDEEIDMAEVKGQESVKRALEIAAAGGHHLFMLRFGCPATVLDRGCPTRLGLIDRMENEGKTACGEAGRRSRRGRAADYPSGSEALAPREEMVADTAGNNPVDPGCIAVGHASLIPAFTVHVS